MQVTNPGTPRGAHDSKDYQRFARFTVMVEMLYKRAYQLTRKIYRSIRLGELHRISKCISSCQWPFASTDTLSARIKALLRI